MVTKRIHSKNTKFLVFLIGSIALNVVIVLEVKPVIAQVEIDNPNQSSVEVTKIKLVGNTVFSDSQLSSIVAPVEGKEVSIEELFELRTKITEYYAERGYTSTSATIALQDFDDGIIEIQIAEGSLKAVEIEGLSRLNRGYVVSRLPPMGKPLNTNTLRDSLVRLREDPLIEDLEAGLVEVSPGQNVVNLKIIEDSSFESQFTVTNTFSPSIGGVGGTASIDYHLLGLGDIINLNYTRTASNGLSRYGAGYSIPVNRHNGKINLGLVIADAEIVEDPISALDIQADFDVYQLGFRQPINLDRDRELALEIKAELIDSKTFVQEDIPAGFVAGLEDEGRSQITALRLIQEYFGRGEQSSIAARSQFNVGLPIFDATETDVGIDGLFWSWQGQGQWLRRFDNLLLVSTLNIQLTNDNLLPVEQLTLGGNESVRGYRQNLILGDSGAIGNVELQIPLIETSRSSIKLIPSVAAGTVWNTSTEIEGADTLVSVGLGLSYALGELIEARVDYAVPLIEVEAPEDFSTEQEFTFTLSIRPF